MIVSEISTKMIEYSKGNLHDINHFMKVYAYAKTIGECEKLGNTNGKYQEKEGEILVAEFLKDTGYSEEFINRVVFLVGHHHTLKDITGLDYQILVEADYIVNADESHYSKANINNAMEKIFKTPTGIALLKSIYGLK